jgi:hypothetical protein
MTTLTESNASIRDRLDYISSRLILMSLNIHIELNDGRLSLSHSNEIRKYSDLSLVTSSLSNTFIDELFVCIEYYCHEVNKLANELRSIIHSSSLTTNPLPHIDNLSKGSELCLNVLHNYHLDRSQAVQSMLSSPFREDAWYLVYEIDSNIFGKCRIILIRLRIYFLLMHQILTDDIDPQIKLKPRNAINKRKRGNILDFKV